MSRSGQEDFCQALGIPTSRKYESEGGPGLAACFQFARSATEVPAREAIKLVDYLALTFLVGNHDAHAKNYSLLYRPGTASAVLAPAYDVLSTIAYCSVRPMSLRMAMTVGGALPSARPAPPRRLGERLPKRAGTSTCWRRSRRSSARAQPGSRR